MERSKILNYSTSNRIRLILEDKEPMYIIHILSNSLRMSVPSLLEFLTVDIHLTKQVVFLRSNNTVALGGLFYRLINKGIEFESSTPNELRVNLQVLITKLS